MRLLLTCLLFCVPACDDGDTPDAGPIGQDAGGGLGGDGGAGGMPQAFEEALTAQIAGEPFAAQLVLGNAVDGELRFQSDQSQERQMFFVLPADVEAGTYDLSADGDYTARYGVLFEGDFPAESGTIVVDVIDRERREISGTFEFVAAQDNFGEITRVEITDGKFAVEYNEL